MVSNVCGGTKALTDSQQDTPYRTLALLSTIMLMTGVVSLANATNTLQVAFAAAYILLNVLYWVVSALNPCRYHWQHAYDVKVLPLVPLPKRGTDGPGELGLTEELKAKFNEKFQKQWRRFENSWVLSKRLAHQNAERDRKVEKGAQNFTAALWTAIVLTGTSQWLNDATTIAPTNTAWKKWLLDAEKQVRPKIRDGGSPRRRIDEYEGRFMPRRFSRINTGENWTFTPASHRHPRRIKIHDWDYQGSLTKILKEQADQTRVPIEDEIDDIGDIDESVIAPEPGNGTRKDLSITIDVEKGL